MKANRKFSKDEEAVSPVIGVILMVAITVILAAVIAAFVFGMGGTMKKQYIVAATASHIGTDIVVTFNGGPDAGQVSALVVTGDFSPALILGNTTGSSNSSTASTADNTNHVIVTATFMDGSQQVILDTYV